MRIIRFLYKGKSLWGLLESEQVRVLKRGPFDAIDLEESTVSLKEVKLLAPCVPSKIILAGLNYREHAKELGMPIPDEPVIFLKPPTSVVGDQDVIVYPRETGRLDYEGELALVIKKEGKNISEQQAPGYILGYTCLNDVTARDLQKKDGQWTRAKGFDTFCPVGPWIETDFNPQDKRITTIVNGAVKQDSRTSDFIFSVHHLVAFISRVMTLFPGDIISTGTPSGIGPISAQDEVTVRIEGIGELTNRVA